MQVQTAGHVVVSLEAEVEKTKHITETLDSSRYLRSSLPLFCSSIKQAAKKQ